MVAACVVDPVGLRGDFALGSFDDATNEFVRATV
jgi:hypothetical protein